MPQNMRRFLADWNIARRRFKKRNMFIHEHNNWTDFRWDSEKIAILLDEVCREQGRLFGRLSCLGFDGQIKTMAENLALDVVYSSEIEGIRLNVDEVRSSIAQRLGIENVKNTAPSHYVDNVVAVVIEAMQNYERPISKEILCAWQAAFFPTGFSEGAQIETGRYRSHEEHIVSGFLGHERVHYIAPSPERVEAEMDRFIKWFNDKSTVSQVIRSAVAHFWFVSIHPFEDGNGRLARILADILLARGDKSQLRFYNISSEINRDKNHYYNILEHTQRGNGDITKWIEWYLQTLLSAVKNANMTVSTVLNKRLFWMRMGSIPLSERQTRTLNLYLDGYEAKITTKNWAALNKCSTDTANRDIQDLVNKGVLHVDILGAKRPSYTIVGGEISKDFVSLFTDIKIVVDERNCYIEAQYKTVHLRERILTLDAERYAAGDLPLEHLLTKYFSYLSNK